MCGEQSASGCVSDRRKTTRSLTALLAKEDELEFPQRAVEVCLAHAGGRDLCVVQREGEREGG